MAPRVLIALVLTGCASSTSGTPLVTEDPPDAPADVSPNRGQTILQDSGGTVDVSNDRGQPEVPEAGQDAATPMPDAGQDVSVTAPDAGQDSATATPDAGQPIPEAGPVDAGPDVTCRLYTGGCGSGNCNTCMLNWPDGAVTVGVPVVCSPNYPPYPFEWNGYTITYCTVACCN